MQTKSPCRDVTPEEITHYREHGWAKLKGFVRPPVVKALLETAYARLGADGDSNVPLAEIATTFLNPAPGAGLSDPTMRPLLEGLGKNANALLARRARKGIRYFADYFGPKLPAGSSRHHIGDGESPFHQDFSGWSLDCSDGMSFWIALTDLTPESGTMSFASGSHRLGVLGHYDSYINNDLLQTRPEILDHCRLTGPLAYEAGDATVHSSLCAHGAGLNLTMQPRWAYLVIVNPADVRWTGVSASVFDFKGLQPFQEVDDARYPIIA